jgi:hypothetical protein
MTRTTYSTKLKEALDDLRPAFRDVGQSLAHLTKKRAELAPTFEKTWQLWRRETHRPFVAFVAALDPSMPADRKAYRSHPSYRAAQYLQQLATDPDHHRRRGLTPLGALAVTIKSIMPLFKSEKDRQDALAIILAATKWRDADQAKLRAAVMRAKAVGLPNAPRLVEVNRMAKAAVVAFERDRIAS